MTFAEILTHFPDAKQRGDEWRARCSCPDHEDKNPSLDIAEKDGRVVLICRSRGCPTERIIEGAGLKMSDLFLDNGTGRTGRGPALKNVKKPPKRVESIEAEIARFGDRFGGRWDYHDAEGEFVFAVVRVNRDGGKDYFPYHHDGESWVVARPKIQLPLYELPELLKGTGAVLVVEGEKCADAAIRLGLRCTTWAGGANSVEKSDWQPLVGEDVVVWRDNDVDGQAALDRIGSMRAKLDPDAVTRFIDIDKLGLPPKGGIVNWIEDRGACRDADLRELVERMMSEATTWKPREGGDEQTHKPHLSIRSLAGIEPQPIQWLWPLRVPIGKVTIFMGYGDVGKSFITHAIGAVVSAGMKWPLSNDWAEAGDVLYLAHEDGIEDTIVPRLKAAGANMDRVAVIEGVIRKLGAEPDWVQLDKDLRHLDAVLDVRPACRLLVVDPITAYLGEAESHKDADVRRVLGPLARLAEKHRVAVVCILHWNKRLGAPAMLRGSGSVAFGNLARVVHAVAKDPRDPTRHIMAVAKMNIAKHPPALGFRIDGDPPVVHWIADTPDIAADQLADGMKPKTQLSETVEWLRKQLADGPRPSTELIAEGIEEGFCEKTIRRAKGQAGIRHRTETDDDGNRRTVWLPPEPDQSDQRGKVGQVGQVDQPDRGEAA